MQIHLVYTTTNTQKYYLNTNTHASTYSICVFGIYIVASAINTDSQVDRELFLLDHVQKSMMEEEKEVR